MVGSCIYLKIEPTRFAGVCEVINKRIQELFKILPQQLEV